MSVQYAVGGTSGPDNVGGTSGPDDTERSTRPLSIENVEMDNVHFGLRRETCLNLLPIRTQCD